jgi:hypothetical protein
MQRRERVIERDRRGAKAGDDENKPGPDPEPDE